MCRECSEVSFCELRSGACAHKVVTESFLFLLPKAVAEDELCAHDVRVLDISKYILVLKVYRYVKTNKNV